MVGRDRRGAEAYYARGMLEIRSTLHLSLRIAVRCNQVLQRSGAAAEGTGLWRAALPAFVVLDLVVWRILRRSERFGLAWRLPLDSLDAAFWTLSPHPSSGRYELAVLIAVPLAVEAGVRVGWRALVVPAGVVGSAAAAGFLVGNPFDVLALSWLVLAVVLGTGFFRYCRRMDERAERERRAVLRAARRRAYLAGQNQVAMGASSVVDAIEGLVPVLGVPRSGSAFWRLADGWKSQLSSSTAEEARYLQVALLEWERAHNRHPDLSGLVRVVVDEGQGTTLLTATQAEELGRALDALDLRGRVAVRLRDADVSRLPGQAVRLIVNGHAVVVHADRRTGPPPFDPCALAYSYVFVLQLTGPVPVLGGIPVVNALAGAAICLLAGVASHRAIVAHGERARMSVFGLAVAVGLALGALAHAARVPFTPDGDGNFGFGSGIILLAFLGGFYWRALARRPWLMPAAVTLVTGFGLLMFPAHATAREVAAVITYNLFAYFPSRHLDRTLRAAAGRHAASTDALDEGAERAAFLEGRESVVALVRQARDDALEHLRRMQPRLDARVADLAADRLEEVERRLRSIEPGPGAASAMG